MTCMCGTEMELKRIDQVSRWGRDGLLVRVLRVPTWVCPECGEQILEHAVAQRVSEIVRDASIKDNAHSQTTLAYA